MKSLENMNAKVTFNPNLLKMTTILRNHISAVEVCGIEFHIRKSFLSWKIVSPNCIKLDNYSYWPSLYGLDFISTERKVYTS